VGRRHLALAAAAGEWKTVDVEKGVGGPKRYRVKTMSNSVNSLARGPIKWCGLRVTASER
jgi:hypothetical protein